MKWFKHDADAHMDARLKRVQIKYGMIGYGLYWYCIELIANNVNQNKITFELEHDAEIIAHDTGIHYEVVQEMITHMVEVGLFENTNGIITCMKIAKRLDQSMTSNPEMRRIIKKLHDNNPDTIMTKSTESHDAIMTKSCKIRLDKNIKDMSKSDDLDFNDFWENYPRKDAKKRTNQIWMRLTKSKRQKAIKDSKTRYLNIKKDFIPLPTTYLNGERWNDERPKSENDLISTWGVGE